MRGRPDRASLAVLDEVFRDYGPLDFSVRLWNSQSWPAGVKLDPKLTIDIHRSGVLRRMLLSQGDLQLCEAFVGGDLGVDGDLSVLFRLRDHIETLHLTPKRLARLFWLWLQLPVEQNSKHAALKRSPARLTGRRHSLERDGKAIAFHYDVSNEFYALWLDQRMVYSCAYFPTGKEDLDSAQECKLDHICRKLQLKRGERLLDIGCGWGGLAIFAAERYGVEVLGVTLSAAQAEYAQAAIRRAALQNRVRIDQLDYRGVPRELRFDKIAAIGLIEHIGIKNYPNYFQRIHELLKPGGLFLNHGIEGPANLRERIQSEFVDRYVFPDGELCDIGRVLSAAALAGFEVLDVESLRQHYELTLHHWVRRLLENRSQALQYVDESTFRVWQLYMTGAAYYFDIGRLNLYQAVLSKPALDGSRKTPWSRAYLYAS